MTTPLPPELRAKILTAPVLRLIETLGDARVVGGAVRDALVSRLLGDIDLATPLPPERVMEILTAKGIKCVPTGITHGTITAIINRTGYEITTLRHDVETDGRHAKVEFTDDWEADAARRDFTFNALYVDAQGNLYDYFNGQADAHKGLVRFIGDPRQRIKEDVLRIFRFFRIYAHFGKGVPDADALAACKELASLIPTLSIERITHEFMRLLSAPNPVPSLHLMQECGVIPFFFPRTLDIDRLEGLLQAEKDTSQPINALTRLAALLPQDERLDELIAEALRLSNADRENLSVLARLPQLLQKAKTPNAIRQLIYAFGPANTQAAAVLNGGDTQVLELIQDWEMPKFPLKGSDILKLGVPPGPQVGATLREVENWWMKGDFQADKAACLARAEDIGKNH